MSSEKNKDYIHQMNYSRIKNLIVIVFFFTIFSPLSVFGAGSVTLNDPTHMNISCNYSDPAGYIIYFVDVPSVPSANGNPIDGGLCNTTSIYGMDPSNFSVQDLIGDDRFLAQFRVIFQTSDYSTCIKTYEDLKLADCMSLPSSQVDDPIDFWSTPDGKFSLTAPSNNQTASVFSALTFFGTSTRENAVASVGSSVSGSVSSIWPIIVVVIAIPLAFYILESIIQLMAMDRGKSVKNVKALTAWIDRRRQARIRKMWSDDI